MDLQYKMIALDVDGTLLNDQYELTKETAASVRLAHAAGVRIVLSTGRGPSNAIPILEQMGLEGVLITHNGAVTVQTPGNELLHQISFQASELEPLIRHCRAAGIHFDACTAMDMFAERISETAKEMYGRYMLYPAVLPDLLAIREPLVKFTMFGTAREMDRIEAALADLGLPLSLNHIRSGDHFIDVIPSAASKGEALKELAALWGIDRSEVLAIGNYFNDIEMIRFAGLGIAMANSPEEVKKEADAVTASNNEEGVSAAIRRYVISR